MPVILASRHYDQWLDPKFDQTEALLSVLSPCPAELMTCYRVSPHVNNPRNDTPQCADRISDAIIEVEDGVAGVQDDMNFRLKGDDA